MILKVAVKSNGLALEAQTEDFVSLPGSACVTELAINSQTEDLCVADSSPSGGIYFVDCKDAFFTKLIKNRSPSLTVYDVSVTGKGNSVGVRTSVEDPHGVPSSQTISGTRMTLEALKRIQHEIIAVNRDYVSKVNVKALVTLLIEHFNTKMRSIYDMPTVQ